MTHLPKKKIRKKQDLYDLYPNMSTRDMSTRLANIIAENRSISLAAAKKIQLPYNKEVLLFKGEVDPIYFGEEAC